MASLSEAWLAYKLRWRRRRYLARAIRKRHELTTVRAEVPRDPAAMLAFSTIRNEVTRLPYWLEHHRALGIDHFLIVDNGSDDGTAEYLAQQKDVSVWRSEASYKASRFGVDWLAWLQLKYAPGRWALTVDADELFVYPDAENRNLRDLTEWLDGRGIRAMAALMLDMYPRGALSSVTYAAGDDPAQALPYFDADGYAWEQQAKYRNISIRGGPRKRVFFANAPDHAPHMHKVPLVKWARPYVYVSSTHIALPRHLNAGFDRRTNQPTGALLHTKFLPEVIEKSASEKTRAEHFTHPERYGDYYDRIVDDPVLWHAGSVRYAGPSQLVELGLMYAGDWGQTQL
ncbi:glycosyltransferase family 2 protein [Shimia ponticola]|uniref:glycosyltransferase family 2 protein n=1 Tax=Shimia ponticola TaxID=2582893 RepID=UPI0011BE7BBD|nr:glycosyltransferase family 2 protein [Shimia ponticola]